MNVADLFPSLGKVQRIYCDKCSGHLDLSFSDFEEDVSGVHISLSGLPVLVCPSCSSTYLPDRSRFALIELHRQAIAKKSNLVTVNRNKTARDFGFTEVPFQYDSDDYNYIPGLTREFNEGFLTPVFFNREVLIKYDTLALLEEWLRKYFRPKDPKPFESMFKAFRTVRRLRQKPAHAVNENLFDLAYFKEQRQIMIDAYDALRTLRLVLANHPKVRLNPPEIQEQLVKGEIWDI